MKRFATNRQAGGCASQWILEHLQPFWDRVKAKFRHGLEMGLIWSEVAPDPNDGTASPHVTMALICVQICCY